MGRQNLLKRHSKLPEASGKRFDSDSGKMTVLTGFSLSGTMEDGQSALGDAHASEFDAARANGPVARRALPKLRPVHARAQSEQAGTRPAQRQTVGNDLTFEFFKFFSQKKTRVFAR